MSIDRVNPPPKPGDHLLLLHRLFLNQYQMRLVALFGGEPGISSSPLLDEILIEVEEAAGPDRHGDLFLVAAAYGLGLARRPFNDGNLRLAAVAMATMIRLNGYVFEPTATALEEVMTAIAEGRMSRLELADWLRRSSRPTEEILQRAAVSASSPPPGES